jgi:hypothetical protein
MLRDSYISVAIVEVSTFTFLILQLFIQIVFIIDITLFYTYDNRPSSETRGIKKEGLVYDLSGLLFH